MKSTPVDEEAKLAETRRMFFEESRFDPTNQKYGLFSFPGTLAISNKPYFTKTASHKAADGTVSTKRSNFLTNPPKRGKTPSVYFSHYEYKSEPYLDPSKPYLTEKQRDEERRKHHNTAWRPGGPKHEPLSLFPHEASDPLTKINKKGSDGLVELGPKNLYTSPPRLGSAMVTPGVLIGGNHFEYVSEPYDRKHKIILEEKRKNDAKMKAGAFRPPNPGGNTFFDDKTTFGEKDIKPKKTLKKSNTCAYFQHKGPFVPSNPGKKGSTIGKYPEHIPDPLASPQRKAPSTAVPWRHTTNQRSRPSPSVSSLVCNLRSEYPLLRMNF